MGMEAIAKNVLLAAVSCAMMTWPFSAYRVPGLLAANGSLMSQTATIRRDRAPPRPHRGAGRRGLVISAQADIGALRATSARR